MVYKLNDALKMLFFWVVPFSLLAWIDTFFLNNLLGDLDSLIALLLFIGFFGWLLKAIFNPNV